jgi:Ca2+-binding EF-hand superfamily protein
MAECIKQMNIQVPKETVDYVFKMADTSGDGRISYDEFRSLFENIIKDQIG